MSAEGESVGGASDTFGVPSSHAISASRINVIAVRLISALLGPAPELLSGLRSVVGSKRPMRSASSPSAERPWGTGSEEACRSLPLACLPC